MTLTSVSAFLIHIKMEPSIFLSYKKILAGSETASPKAYNVSVTQHDVQRGSHEKTTSAPPSSNKVFIMQSLQLNTFPGTTYQVNRLLYKCLKESME